MTLAGLELDLHPGHSLGIFVLGTSLWSILEMLRQRQTTFSQVAVSFDSSNPASSPVVVHLRPYIDLLFSATEQRLHTISLRSLRSETSLIIWYKSHQLTSSDQPLRRMDVSKMFGPTYAGPTMRYPGVWFGFEEDMQLGNKKALSEDRTQEVKRIVVSQPTEAISDTVDPLDSITSCEAMDGEIQHVEIQVHDGVIIQFHSFNTSRPSLHFRLRHTTPQDLILGLGPPLRIYHKEDDRIAIHGRQHSGAQPQTGAYFYNYFQHGLDFLISEETQTVQKIVVHSNIPGSALFQRYKRCPWEIRLAEGNQSVISPINLKTNTDDVIRSLGPRTISPRMRLDRTEDDEVTLPNSTTSLIGLDGLVLEATEFGKIASLTVF